MISERTAGNQGTIKENNQQLIIDTLVKNGATSRAELAKNLKLSAPSVSKNINDLIKKNILIEIGEGDSIGGRRPILVQFNYNYGYIIGVDMSGQELKIALANLKSEIIELRTIDISNINKGKEILDIIADNIFNIFAKNHLPIDKLLVIAIGFPGIIEDTGRVVALPMWLYLWEDLNIKEELRKRFKVEIIFKNDMNLAALGECGYGVGKEYRNLVYVSIDIGVGAGVILNKTLYEGNRLAAGEIGYFALNIADAQYNHQSVGPLESRVGIPAIIESIKKGVCEGRSSFISDLIGGDVNRINSKVIEKAIQCKDPFVMAEMEQIVHTLGVVLSNIIILLDLDLIVLGGKLMDLGYDFITPLNQIVSRIVPFEVQVRSSALEQNAIIYGAFTIALDYIYKNILKE
jgi:predicted NBD/HSP70 family sugar kinase